MEDRDGLLRRGGLGACCLCVSWVMAGLLAAAGVAGAAEAAGAAQVTPVVAELDADEGMLQELEEIVVYGADGGLVEGLYAESELDEAAIASYGADTVGDLLAQVAPDVDNTEQGPIILINGRPTAGITSVNQLPADSVQSVQVLPPQAAAALGFEPTRRVINVVLKNSYRQRQVTGTVRGATAGRGRSGNGNFTLVSVDGNRFRNLSAYATRTRPLLEAHRGIQSQPLALPYDLVGNVVSWPMAGGDIDPALSAMTGYPVTVLGVPDGLGTPTLEDFMALANTANASDVSRFRTLVADTYGLGVNGNFSFQLPRNIFAYFTLNADMSHSVSRTGAPTALLHVPADSPYSPFSQDVAVARYLGAPLQQESDPVYVYLYGNVSGRLGRWQLTANLNYSWRHSESVTDRRVDIDELQAAIDAGLVNPFAPLPPELVDEVLVDNARSRNHNGSLQLQASTTVYKLPAGNATLSLRGELRDSSQSSRTTGTNSVTSHRSRRDELAFASLQVPILGKPLPQAFAWGAELSGSARDVTAVGTLYDYGYGMNWRLGTRMTLRVAVNHEKVAPQPELLTNPVIVIDDVRTYDFIRQETVLVRYITGGNPDLDVERRRTSRVGLTARPFASVDFNINADYQRTIGHDAASSLPAVSEDVQAAFPDRYRRDETGRLVEVDARLVSFARTETEQIRWGGNFRRAFGQRAAASPAPAQQRIVYSEVSGMNDLEGAGWRLNANFTHTWQLANRRLARAGLPEQDLLSGGAGSGTGQSRHNVQSRVGLAFNGTGLQLTVNWKSRSLITAGTAEDPNDIVFDPLLRIDLNAFTDLGMLFPSAGLLKGSRLTLGVENLFDAKQRVHDQTGATPLRYQPYLLNALGRTISLSLRKAF
ncbi:MAG: hypothetical protein DIU62_002750 [Pseudomonadota bacterium]|jgi:iron complex outermembrane receptor protein